MTYQGFGFLGVLAILGIVFAAIAFLLPYLISPKRNEEEKLETYECGEIAMGSIRIPIDVQYYTYALIFVIFDVETLFLYLWAVVYKDLGFLTFVEMWVFIGILLVGFVYAWRRGALEWLTSS